MIEAMASGIPFVASDVGGVRDITTKEQQEFIVPKTGFDVPAQPFADALIAMLKDSRKRDFLAKQGKDWVQQYDLAPVLKQFTQKVLKAPTA